MYYYLAVPLIFVGLILLRRKVPWVFAIAQCVACVLCFYTDGNPGWYFGWVIELYESVWLFASLAALAVPQKKRTAEEEQMADMPQRMRKEYYESKYHKSIG